MDAEIQFGDLEHAEPEVRLRPDHNKHYAVAAYGSPDVEDLPIFVDLDVMRDMEAHALSDTSVELGGVMLGGQFEDEDGEPFVIVTDSLRAQHYEATKGSFKFTHETWEKISRERDEFPDDLQMVGWYHTHPDWGVFLSGMDMFICDNFFNKSLDLALVIDPCRDDRGMFQWTPDPRNRIRRTGGFYLISSRFRLHELELYACQLEGRITMASDSRYSGIAGHVGPAPAPVVNISENRGGFQGLAVVGMLMMQFLLLALIAWRMLVPASGDDGEKQDDKYAKQIAAVEKKIDALAESDRTKREVAIESQIQTQVLDRIVSQLVKDPQNLVHQFTEQQRELAFRDAEHRSDMRLVQLLHEEKAELEGDIGGLQKELTVAKNEAEDYRKKLSAASKEAKQKTEEVAKLNKQVAALSGKDGSAKSDDETGGTWSPLSIGITVAVVMVLIVAGIGFTVLMRKPGAEESGLDENAGKGPFSPLEPKDEVDFKDGGEQADKPNDQ